MKDTLFISGWAGFKELFPEINKKYDIFLPFIDFIPGDTEIFFKNKNHKNLIGWSTGSHIILNHLQFFYDKFDKIILFASFDKFTRFYDKRILRLMRKKLKTDTRKVICDFMIKAGMKNLNLLPEDNLPVNELNTGLEYLENCFIQPGKIKNCSKLYLIQGIYDEIVLPDSADELNKFFLNSTLLKVKTPHFFDGKTIEYYNETLN